MAANAATRTEIKPNTRATSAIAPGMIAVAKSTNYTDVPIGRGMFARIQEMMIPDFPGAEVKSITIMDANNKALIRRCECTAENCSCVVESCEDNQSIYCSCSNNCQGDNFGCT